ncbi:hypothetical protein ILYODFUR_031836 [Ilyodon furcidens]|uniref:Uncharacterized protein n=1 Tax=Ilyodon furcidens TaxID=33524 RepID=A0ABV0U0N9_9TELE
MSPPPPMNSDMNFPTGHISNTCIRPRSPMQPSSPATASLQHPHSEARATAERTIAPTLQHAIQRKKERIKEHPKQKSCTKPTPCKCASTSLPINKASRESATP